MDSLFRGQTKEVILARMLSRTNNSVDRSEDSLVYDASSTCAIELAHLYIEAERVYGSSFMSKALGQDLIDLAFDRGVERRLASHSLILMQTFPYTVIIPLGAVFMTGIASFEVINKSDMGEGLYVAQCREAGTLGNIGSGFLNPASHIPDLEWAQILAVLAPAADDEDLESLRIRGMLSFGFQPYSGNNVYFRRVVGDIPEVGAVKVVHVSAGFVDIYILDNALQIPTQPLIDMVQELVDPLPFGTGMGLSGFGYQVTIKEPQVITIDIDTNVRTPLLWTAAERKAVLSKTIAEVLLNYNMGWESRMSLAGELVIESIQSALYVAGFEDVSGTLINGFAVNFIGDPLAILVGGYINAVEIS